MKKVLITGSNGLLGNTLTYLLSDQPEQFTLLATSKGENRLLRQHGYEYIEMDITSIDQVEKVMKAYMPDVVIHTAALTQVDFCEENQDLAYQVNVLGTHNLASVSNQIGAHLIHVSTDFVFEGKKDIYTEDDEKNPVNFYGRTKLLAEQKVEKLCHKWSIVRTILVYGVSENMSRSNLILWVKKSLEKGKKINVVSDQFRMPTYVGDLAKGINEIAKTGKQGVFHLCGKERYSIIELAYKVADFYKLDPSLITPITSKELNERGKRPICTGFDLETANKKINYFPLSFEEGLVLFDKLHFRYSS